MKIFCDDKAGLRQAVGESRARMSATEMMNKPEMPLKRSQMPLEATKAGRMVVHYVRLKERAKTYASRVYEAAFKKPGEQVRMKEGKAR